MKFSWTAPEYGAGEARPRTVDALSGAFGLAKSRIRSLASDGLVTRSGERFDALSNRVIPGEVYEIDLPEVRPPEGVRGEDIPLDILFEDEWLLVVNKPAGLVVHPAPGHPDGTLVNAVLNHCPEALSVGWEGRPGIVHRLDRDTSGAMVVAKTQDAMTGLASAFKESGISKTYRTLVHGCPDADSEVLESRIGRSRSDRKKMAVLRDSGRVAVSEYSVLHRWGRASELRVKIRTGRTHQIRVHMRYIGHPVLGDAVYGWPSADNALPVRPMRQMLHAWRLEFVHPVTGETVSAEAPLPEDYIAVRKGLEVPG